jgi:lysozyme
MNPHLKKASIAALAVAVIGGAEGLRQSAYPDPATRGHPWTICYGHTGPDVHPGERASLAQCKDLLAADLGREADGIDACLHAPLTDGQYVAVLSLAHNIGVGGVCRSSVVRELNAGHVAAGCNALLQYTHAAGVVMPGLVSRRQRERALCLAKN